MRKIAINKKILYIFIALTVYCCGLFMQLATNTALAVSESDLVDSSWTFYVKKQEQTVNGTPITLWSAAAVKNGKVVTFTEIDWSANLSQSPIQFKLDNPTGGAACVSYISYDTLRPATKIYYPVISDGSISVPEGNCAPIKYNEYIRGKTPDFDNYLTTGNVFDIQLKDYATAPANVKTALDQKIAEKQDGERDDVTPADEEALDPAGTTEDNEAGCDNALSPFGWILCPILNLADNMYGFFVGIVRQTLFFEPEKYNNSDLQEIAGIFVNFANILIVIFALLMIASQIFSFEIFSAYTVKKVLPKIIIGAILIQLSWPIFTLMIQLVNALGTGMYWIMLAPFGDYTDGQAYVEIGSVLGGSAVDNGDVASNAIGLGVGLGVVAAGVAAAVLTGTWLTIILAALGVIISLVVAILTLVMREVVLIILLVIAPLALAFWIFPGTTKFWNLWWKSFSSLLLMYPLIMLLIAGGTVAATILATSGASQDGINIGKILAVIAYFAPIFMIGWTYKFAGQAFGSIATMSNKFDGKSKGSGMFGLRGRAKSMRENSDWALSRKSREADVNRNYQQKYANRITGTGARGRAFRHMAGTTDEGRTRAEASAAAIITSANEQMYKDRAALTEFQIRKIADEDKTVGVDRFEKESRVRAEILSGGTGTKTINGIQVAVTKELQQDTAIQALRNKDGKTGAPGIETYISDPGNFQSLKDYGTENSSAWSVLAEKLPTAAKGASSASLADVSARGFNDARKNFAALAEPQQTQVIQGIVAHHSTNPNEVATILSDLTRNTPNIDQQHLATIEGQFAAAGITGVDLAKLRNDPNSTIAYNAGLGRYEVV